MRHYRYCCGSARSCTELTLKHTDASLSWACRAPQAGGEQGICTACAGAADAADQPDHDSGRCLTFHYCSARQSDIVAAGICAGTCGSDAGQLLGLYSQSASMHSTNATRLRSARPSRRCDNSQSLTVRAADVRMPDTRVMPATPVLFRSCKKQRRGGMRCRRLWRRRRPTCASWRRPCNRRRRWASISHLFPGGRTIWVLTLRHHLTEMTVTWAAPAGVGTLDISWHLFLASFSVVTAGGT